MTMPDRYTCEQVFQRLNDYLDHELTHREIELVEEHLATCAACASEYRFEGQLLESLRAKLTNPTLPPDLAARIRAALNRDANQQHDR